MYTIDPYNPSTTDTTLEYLTSILLRNGYSVDALKTAIECWKQSMTIDPSGPAEIRRVFHSENEAITTSWLDGIAHGNGWQVALGPGGTFDAGVTAAGGFAPGVGVPPAGRIQLEVPLRRASPLGFVKGIPVDDVPNIVAWNRGLPRKWDNRPSQWATIAPSKIGSTSEFTMWASPDKAKGIYGALNKDGLVEFVIEAGPQASPHGRVLFAEMMEHFGSKAKGVVGSWSYGDNLARFNQLVAQGMTPAKAAAQTWTGTQAARFGFTTVRIVTTEGAPGAYTKVIVEFLRP